MESKPDAAPVVVTGQRTPVVIITVTAVFIALVFLSTSLFQIPIPATQGYFNLGDIMIFITALTFGPLVGGFAGGVGSFLSDALAGYGTFAPFTLIIKGMEGFVAGLISRRSVQRRTLMLAWAAGSVIMVLGYFLAESFLIAIFFGSSSATGIAAASGEVPFNILQVVGGGVVGIPVSIGLKLAFRSMPYLSRMTRPAGGLQTEKN